MNKSDWTEDRVALLKKLWADGLSCSAIANRMGGITRNAVIGKVSRLGLSGRYSKIRQSEGGKRGAKTRRKIQKTANLNRPKPIRPMSAVKRIFDAEPFVPRSTLEVPASERKTLDQINEMDCRFPYGDGPFTFCGRPKVTGISYCLDHARICLQPPTPARRPGEPPARSLRIVAGTDLDKGSDAETQEAEIASSGLPRAKETV